MTRAELRAKIKELDVDWGAVESLYIHDVDYNELADQAKIDYGGTIRPILTFKSFSIIGVPFVPRGEVRVIHNIDIALDRKEVDSSGLSR